MAGLVVLANVFMFALSIGGSADRAEAAGPAASVVVSTSGVVGCGNSIPVTIVVRDAVGAAVNDGTAVSVSVSFGTLSASALTTVGGVATTTYTASGNAIGTAVISAASNNVLGQAGVQIACGVAGCVVLNGTSSCTAGCINYAIAGCATTCTTVGNSNSCTVVGCINYATVGCVNGCINYANAGCVNGCAYYGNVGCANGCVNYAVTAGCVNGCINYANAGCVSNCSYYANNLCGNACAYSVGYCGSNLTCAPGYGCRNDNAALVAAIIAGISRPPAPPAPAPVQAPAAPQVQQVVAAAPAPAPAPAPVAAAPIRAPNTGDAGLIRFDDQDLDLRSSDGSATLGGGAGLVTTDDQSMRSSEGAIPNMADAGLSGDDATSASAQRATGLPGDGRLYSLLAILAVTSLLTVRLRLGVQRP